MANSEHTIVFDDIRESIYGLTESDAIENLQVYGKNVLKKEKKSTWLKSLISQFTDLMIIILIASSIISFLLGENSEGIAILAIVMLNGLLGFFQELKTEKAMEALMNMTAPHAKIIRDGLIKDIPADMVVPRDLIVVQAGDRVPADSVIIEANSLFCDESMLTGESLPASKSEINERKARVDAITNKNIIYMGSLITNGTGKAVVVATGMQTEMGKIAGMMETAGVEETPLQKRLQKLGEIIVILCLVICALVSIMGIIRGEPIVQMFLAGISLAVAAVPEGLPAVVTIALAIGIRRMVQRNALIRRLPAVETLGCATVICSDKTGTLTENRMTVVSAYVSKNSYRLQRNAKGKLTVFKKGREIYQDRAFGLNLMLKIGLICGNTHIISNSNNRDSILDLEGNPTEVGLARAAIDSGLDKEYIDSYYKRIREIPFDSERKLMSVVCKTKTGELYVFVKGAPEVVLEKSTRILVHERDRKISYDDKEGVLKEIREMSTMALRVMGFAYKKIDNNVLWKNNIEDDLVFVGLSGMTDPPRKEVFGAVKNCRRAGIKTIMITGDHKETAKAVAKDLDIYRDGDIVLTGAEMDQMSDREFEKTCSKVTVYARVYPKHKLRIVRAYRENGHIVAMTGDGVNDAPAVKDADIGIAMGKSGTDVTREAAAMILMDDNFSSIVAAVEEGRNIYSNIRKFIRYLLSCNVGEVLTMFLASLIGLPIPLLPAQILIVNLATDGLPAIALSMEPGEPDIMNQPPRAPKESIFAHGLSLAIIIRGILIALSTLATFIIIFTSSENIATARTCALVTLVLSQLIHVFECKSENKGIFDINIFSNMYLVLAVISSVLMLCAVIYIPFLMPVFATVPLTSQEWLISGGISLLVPIIYGIWQDLRRKKRG